MHNLVYQMDSSDLLFSHWLGRYCFNIWLDYWSSMRPTINMFNRFSGVFCIFFYLPISLQLNGLQTLIRHAYIKWFIYLWLPTLLHGRWHAAKNSAQLAVIRSHGWQTFLPFVHLFIYLACESARNWKYAQTQIKHMKMRFLAVTYQKCGGLKVKMHS